MIQKSICIIGLFLLTYASTHAQVSPVGTVGFYNVENLFDTINDPMTIDEEYLATGSNKWTEERYQSKLNNMSRVIADMASGVDILGLSEVENRVLREIGLGAGAINVYIWQGHNLTSDDIKNEIYKKI